MENYTAIIDADSIMWTTAYLAQDTPSYMVRPNLDKYLNEMLSGLGVTHYVGLLGGDEPTQKKDFVGTYKSSRPSRPDFFIHYSPLIKDYLINRWQFQVVEKIEADDACSILAAQLRRENKKYVVCGIDKDLKQIPGTHYNYKTKESTVISQEEADHLLFLQTLTGDSVDSIPGLPGIGPAKAQKILSQVLTIRAGDTIPITVESPDYLKVIQAYCKHYGTREGLAKFSEMYLLVSLQEQSTLTFPLIKYDIL